MAGDLDRRIQILSKNVASRTGYGKGAGKATYSPFGSPIWASRIDVSDGEKETKAGEASELVARFVIRRSEFADTIQQDHRLTCDDQTFEITGIKEKRGRKRYLEITASARSDE